MLLIFIIISNLIDINAKATGITTYGTQVGGRIITVSVCTPPPVPNPLCVAALCQANPIVSVMYVIPFGFSATQVCIPTVGLIMPITPVNIGYQILGLFATPVYPGPAIQLGIIGISL